MIKLLLTILVCTSTYSFATISKPKSPNDKPAHREGMSIGKYEINSKLVQQFMDFVNWDAATEYEETGLKIEGSLLKILNKNIEKKWFEQIAAYSLSAEFLSQDQSAKNKDIFEAKMYAKMIIAEFGLPALKSKMTTDIRSSKKFLETCPEEYLTYIDKSEGGPGAYCQCPDDEITYIDKSEGGQGAICLRLVENIKSK